MMTLRTLPSLLLSAYALMFFGCSDKAPQNRAAQEAKQSSEAKGGYRIYVTNETTGDMSIIDSATHTVVATVPLGKRPRGIHPSPDGKTIYVALSGSPIAGPGVDESTLPPPDKSADGIGVFDVATSKLVRVIKSGSDPEEFDLSKDGKLLYVSNEDAGAVTILETATGRIVKTLPVGEEPEGVETSPDGASVYVTSEDAGTIAVIDTASASVRTTFKVGRRPRSTAFSPDGSRAYVTAENDAFVRIVDARKHAPLDTIQLGQPGVIKPMAVLLSRDGSTLFASTGRGRRVFAIDTASHKVKGSVEVGTRPWGIALAPDGQILYSANGPSKDISAVDLRTMSVIKSIPVSGSPWGVITLER